MICDEAQLELSAYLDNEVPAQERSALEAHIKECPVCQAMLADLSSVKSSLSDLPKVKAPAPLADSIRREAKNPVSEAPATNVVLFPSTPRRSVRASAIMGIAALLVAGLMIFVLLPLVSQRANNQLTMAPGPDENRRAPAVAAPAVQRTEELEKPNPVAGENAPTESRNELQYKAEAPAERKAAVDALKADNALRKSAPAKASQESGKDAEAAPSSAQPAKEQDGKPAPEASQPFKDEALSGRIQPKPGIAGEPANNRATKKAAVNADDAGAQQDRVAHDAPKAPRQEQLDGAPKMGGDAGAAAKDKKEKIAGTPATRIAPTSPAPAAAPPAVAAAPTPAPQVSAAKKLTAEGKSGDALAKEPELGAADAKNAAPADKAPQKPVAEANVEKQTQTWSSSSSQKRDVLNLDNAKQQDAASNESKANADLDAPDAAKSKAGKADAPHGFGGGQGSQNGQEADSAPLALSVQRASENTIVCKTRNPARLIRELKKLSDARGGQFGMGDLASLPKEELTRNSTRELRTKATPDQQGGGKPAEDSNHPADPAASGAPGKAAAAAPASKTTPEPIVYKISIAAGGRQALLAGIQKFAGTESPEVAALKGANKFDDKLKESGPASVDEAQENRQKALADDKKERLDQKDAVVERERAISPESTPAGDETIIYIEVITVP